MVRPSNEAGHLGQGVVVLQNAYSVDVPWRVCLGIAVEGRRQEMRGISWAFILGCWQQSGVLSDSSSVSHPL